MGRTPDSADLVARLRQQAPNWWLQMPALLSPAEHEALQRSIGGTTRERMLRELAEAVEGLTATRPCVLVLEDLHWSDAATIEWLAWPGGEGRRGCWCWARIVRWRRLCGRTPCAPWYRHC